MEVTQNQIDEYIKKNYNSYLNTILSLNNHKLDSEDILHETLMQYYEDTFENRVRIFPYLDYYIIRIFKLSVYSPVSTYAWKYDRQKYHNIFFAEIDGNVPDIDNSNKDDKWVNIINDIVEHCKSITWYEREVFRRYVNSDKTWRDLSSESHIPSSSLHNTFTKVVKKIKRELKKYD